MKRLTLIACLLMALCMLPACVDDTPGSGDEVDPPAIREPADAEMYEEGAAIEEGGFDEFNYEQSGSASGAPGSTSPPPAAAPTDEDASDAALTEEEAEALRKKKEEEERLRKEREAAQKASKGGA